MVVANKQPQAIGEPKAYIQLWDQRTSGSPETERGFSLHLTAEDAERYVINYWDSQPSQAPVRYISDFLGPLEIAVSQEFYEELLAAKEQGELGIRKEYGPPPDPIPGEFTNLNAWDPDLLRRARLM